MSGMAEVRVRLSPALYERLLERAAALQREPEEVVAEAVERWLEEEDPEARLQRALERSGLLAWPRQKPTDSEALEQDRQRVRQILAKLTTPLSEDIIRSREPSW
ncbi:MAG: hypothetical protein NZ769_11335 [Anaerolineae bacterium]|nr:hypothetical protein [Anaerolineae bacterium]